MKAIGWLMASIFRGGEDGRRRATQVLYLVLAPIGGIEMAVLGAIDLRSIAIRTLALALGLAYLYARRHPTVVEWYLLVGLLPAVANAQGQWLGGPTLAPVFVTNACLFLACMAIVFEARFVAVSTATFIASTLVAQLHLHTTSTALEVTSMVGVGVSLLVFFVNGAAEYLRQTAAELTALHEEREAVHRRMQAAAERERARIAGELHDDAIQVLVAGSMQLDRAASSLSQGDPDQKAVGQVRRAREMIGGAVDRIRSLSFDLYPPQLERAGLAPALERLAHDIEQQQPVSVIVTTTPGRVEHSLERLAYRTFKELAGNAVKHAQAETIRLSAEHDDAALRGAVEDDGLGYDPTVHERRRLAGHIGLDATAERVRLAGGDFTVTSSPGAGTLVAFAIPLRPPDEFVAQTV
jgi:signal transduction histidine kinase